MELDNIQLGEFSLMAGERIDTALDLAGDGSEDMGDAADLVLLTDKRVIHLHGNGRNRRAVIVSIQDIHAVEIGSVKEGSGASVWATLGFIVAILLYVVIDHSVFRVAAPVAVALLALYLIFDQLFSPGKPLVLFNAGMSQLRCELKSRQASSEIYPFITRLFQLKGENDSPPRPFAPR